MPCTKLLLYLREVGELATNLLAVKSALPLFVCLFVYYTVELSTGGISPFQANGENWLD